MALSITEISQIVTTSCLVTNIFLTNRANKKITENTAITKTVEKNTNSAAAAMLAKVDTLEKEVASLTGQLCKEEQKAAVLAVQTKAM